MSERMQSLLSRAVEDQLTEQRQLAGVLAEVRAQLGQLTNQLQSGQPAGGGPGPQLDQALGAIAGNVRDAVRLLGERLDAVARLVQERGHDLAEQRAAIGELKSGLERHTNALGGMTGGLAALPAFGERIDALQSGLGGLSERLRGLEELTAAVGSLQQRSDALDSDLRELRQAFSGVAARAAQLPGREDLESVSGRVAETVDGLGGRLSRLETSVPSVLDRLDALAEAQEQMTSSLADIGDRLREESPSGTTGTGESGELAGVRDEIAAIREHLESSEAGDDDVQTLIQRLDALHEGVLGGDGVVARLQAIEGARPPESPPGLEADEVEQIVAAAVAESERRLADHIDESILTLAEALLRRRARQRASGLGAVLGASEVEAAAVGVEDEVEPPQDLRDVEDEVGGLDEHETEDLDEDDAEDLDEHDEQDENEDEDEDEDRGDDDAGDDPPPQVAQRSPGTPWQTPSPATAGNEDSDDSSADGGSETPRKRRPWWRPGG
jgi:ABC-type transporter Mla subunit MlaD